MNISDLKMYEVVSIVYEADKTFKAVRVPGGYLYIFNSYPVFVPMSEILKDHGNL